MGGPHRKRVQSVRVNFYSYSLKLMLATKAITLFFYKIAQRCERQQTERAVRLWLKHIQIKVIFNYTIYPSSKLRINYRILESDDQLNRRH